MPIPPQFQKAAKRKLAKNMKGKKLIEGSAAEEKTESAAFEKKEDSKKG